MTKKYGKNALLGVTLASMLSMSAQMNSLNATQKEYRGKAELSTFLEEEGLTTQNLLTYEVEDNLITTVKSFIGTQPGNAESIGFDIKNNDFRINLGYSDVINSNKIDPSRALATFYLTGGFLGGKYQKLPDGEKWAAHGGIDLTDKINLEATYGTGGLRGVIFKKSNEANLGFGGGINDNREVDVNIGYTDKKNFLIAKFGNRPLDFRWIYGDVNPKFALFLGSVTGSGINELDDDFTDLTLPFDIGINEDIIHDYYHGNTLFLGKKPGSVGVDLRIREGRRSYIDIARRIGKLGFMDDVSLLGGAHIKLDAESLTNTNDYGIRGAIGFGLGKYFDVYFNTTINKGGNAKSAVFVRGKVYF